MHERTSTQPRQYDNQFDSEVTIGEGLIDRYNHLNYANSVLLVGQVHDVVIGEESAVSSVRSLHIRYFQQVFAGDDLTIRTGFTSANAATAFHHTFIKNDLPAIEIDCMVGQGFPVVYRDKDVIADIRNFEAERAKYMAKHNTSLDALWEESRLRVIMREMEIRYEDFPEGEIDTSLDVQQIGNLRIVFTQRAITPNGVAVSKCTLVLLDQQDRPQRATPLMEKFIQ